MNLINKKTNKASKALLPRLEVEKSDKALMPVKDDEPEYYCLTIRLYRQLPNNAPLQKLKDGEMPVF